MSTFRRSALVATALLSTLAAASAADAAAAGPHRLWYRVRADIAYSARGTDTSGAQTTDVRSWSLRTRAAVLLRRQCVDRRNGRVLARGTCRARFAPRRPPRWAVTDYAFAGKADGLWDEYVATAFTPEETGTFFGRPFRCDAHSGSVEMTAPAHFYGGDSWLRASSARTGAVVELGGVTAPGSLHTFMESWRCVDTEDGTELAWHDGVDETEASATSPLGLLHVAPDRPIPFLREVRFGQDFAVDQARSVRRGGIRASVTVTLRFMACPRHGRDVEHCD